MVEWLKENYLLGLVFKEGIIVTRILQRETPVSYEYEYAADLGVGGKVDPFYPKVGDKEILKVKYPFELYHVVYTPKPAHLRVYPHVPGEQILLSLNDVPATIGGKLYKDGFDPDDERELFIPMDLEAWFAFYNPPDPTGVACRPVLDFEIDRYKLGIYDPAVVEHKKLIDGVLAGKIPCAKKTMGGIDKVSYTDLIKKHWLVEPTSTFHTTEVSR